MHITLHGHSEHSYDQNITETSTTSVLQKTYMLGKRTQNTVVTKIPFEKMEVGYGLNN